MREIRVQLSPVRGASPSSPALARSVPALRVQLSPGFSTNKDSLRTCDIMRNYENIDAKYENNVM